MRKERDGHYLIKCKRCAILTLKLEESGGPKEKQDRSECSYHTLPTLFKFINETGRSKEIKNNLNITRDELERWETATKRKKKCRDGGR